MITLPEFKNKKIVMLFPLNGDNMHFSNSNLMIKDSIGKIKLQYTCYKIFSIFIVGNITLTSSIIAEAKKYNFSIVFLTSTFKEYEVINNGLSGNTLLRKKQYYYNQSIIIAKKIIENKIKNQFAFIKKIRKDSQTKSQTLSLLKSHIKKINNVKDNYSLMGIEGIASKVYFKEMFNENDWHGRQPRLKKDITNFLLDIGYTLLFNYIKSLLILYGFDIYYGNLHQEFYQRESLVCDIIEPFRPIVDYKIRKMYSLKQINENDFLLYKNKYELQPNKNRKYINELLSEILSYKDSIFKYIQLYYRWFINEMPQEKFPIMELQKNDNN
jgi:CRISP-associated protein Cas1